MRLWGEREDAFMTGLVKNAQAEIQILYTCAYKIEVEIKRDMDK